MSDFLGCRDGIWCYVRRVPIEFADLDRRGIIKLSTKVRIADDPRAIRARKVVRRLNADTETYWRDLQALQTQDATARYQAACRRARALGFDYVPAREVAEHDLEEIARRFAAIVDAGHEDKLTHQAVLGGIEAPSFRLAGLLEAFEAIMQPSLASMSEDQRRKWRNPKRRAIANLLQVIGDKPVAEISRGDALDFRSWWSERVWRTASRSARPTRTSAISTRCCAPSIASTGWGSIRSSPSSGSRARRLAPAPPSKQASWQRASWPTAPLTA